jgi:intracellular sulfur oxidation DsrE/DsrF family protein
MSSRRDFLAAAATSPAVFADIRPILASPRRHRQVFGISQVRDGVGLGQMRNSLNAYEYARREGAGTLHALAVLYGNAVALVLDDAAWRTYRLGEALRLRGDEVRREGARDGNPFAHPHALAGIDDPADPRSAAQDASIAALVQRGAGFFVCLNALTGFATALVTDGFSPGPVDRVLAALRAQLLPGAIVVPAGVAAINDAQEARYTYVAV